MYSNHVRADSFCGQILKLLLLVGAWSLFSGATPNPPLLECQDGGECLPPVGGHYDLGELPTELNALQWPEAPNTSRTINVSTMSELQSAVQQPGSRIVVEAGSYVGSLGNFANDVDIVMSNAATLTLTGTLDFGNVQRLRWTGGTIDGNNFSHQIFQADGSDQLFDNVRITDMADILLGLGPVTRLAIINSSLRSNRYGMFTQSGDSHQDIILANNNLEGGFQNGAESTVRLMNVDRAVMVDNRVYNGGKHVFRVHYASDLIYASRNMFVNNGFMADNHPIGGGVLQADRLWIVDNDFYGPRTGVQVQGYHASGNNGVNRFIFTGNRAFQDEFIGWPAIQDAGAGPEWEIDNAAVQPLRTPPPFEGGADH